MVEAHAMAVKDLVLDQVATKEDVENVEQRLEAKIEGLCTEMNASIRRLEWMIGTVGLGILLLLMRSFWSG